MVRIGGDESTQFINANCEAHAQIENFEITGTSMKVTFLLLAATEREQNGKTMNATFTLERGKAAAKTWDLVEAARVIPLGRRKEDLDFDENQLKGRQVYLKIHLERGRTANPVTGKYEDDPTKGMFPQIGFQSISDVWDAKNSSLPKDPAMLAYWPPLPGQGPQNPPAGQAALVQPHQPQPPAPPANPLDGAKW